MGFFVIAVAMFFGFFIWNSEASVRISGYVLQLIGMIFAIRGLLGVRKHFGQPLLRRLIINWFKRFPKWKRNVVIDAGSAHVTIAGMKARAEVWMTDNPNKPIEQRIDAIIKNIERIRVEQREQGNAIDILKESYEEHKKQVTEQNNKIKEDINSDLESLHTSDLITSLVGLVWLTVGITMSTLAPELSKW